MERVALERELLGAVVLHTKAQFGGADLALEDWQLDDLEHRIHRLVYALEGLPAPWDPHLLMAKLLADRNPGPERTQRPGTPRAR